LAYKLLHIGDVHLDMIFAGHGAAAGKMRRAQLQAAFERALQLAKARSANAVCIAGDLFERDHSGLDRAEYLRRVLGGLAPIRVFITPGNHDPYTSKSLYRMMEPLPENVTVFRERRFSPVQLIDGATLWGCAHQRERDFDPILAGVRCTGPGAHLLLFHGSDRDHMPPQKECIAPFSADEVTATGAAHAMVGHFHGMLQGPHYAYSGSLEPHTYAQDGRHTASLVTIEDARVGVEFVDINATRFETAEFDISGFGDRSALFAALSKHLSRIADPPSAVFCRVRLVGSAQPSLDLDVDEAEAELNSAFPGVELKADYASFDVDALEREGHTVRASFIRALRERKSKTSGDDERALIDNALQYGLLAFARKELRP
jgi:DNA repair protein SbcD/Mre11